MRCLWLVALLASSAAAAPARHALALELQAALRKAGAQATVIAEDDTHLDLAIGVARPRVGLDILERQLEDGDHAVVMSSWVATLTRMGSGHKGALDAKLIFPRLVRGGLAGADMLHEPFGHSGLDVVWGADLGSAFVYLNAAELTVLGLSREQLRQLALDNLSKKRDGHDAARLLLLARALAPGDKLAVWLPHGDLLRVVPLPADDAAWRATGDKLRATTAKRPGAVPLLDRLLLVTAGDAVLK